jgi:hypothetical protein
MISTNVLIEDDLITFLELLAIEKETTKNISTRLDSIIGEIKVPQGAESKIYINGLASITDPEDLYKIIDGDMPSIDLNHESNRVLLSKLLHLSKNHELIREREKELMKNALKYTKKYPCSDFASSYIDYMLQAARFQLGFDCPNDLRSVTTELESRVNTDNRVVFYLELCIYRYLSHNLERALELIFTYWRYGMLSVLYRINLSGITPQCIRRHLMRLDPEIDEKLRSTGMIQFIMENSIHEHVPDALVSLAKDELDELWR